MSQPSRSSYDGDDGLAGLLDPPVWVADAECLGTDHNVFFDSDQERLAKSICAVCIVREECLTFALETNQLDGVWGGISFKKGSRDTRTRNQLRRSAKRAV